MNTFTLNRWREQLAERLMPAAQNLPQEMRLVGCPTVLVFLATRALEPFIEAFHDETTTLQAVRVLSEIHDGLGTSLLVRRANQIRYQLPTFVERELRNSAHFRAALDAVLVELRALDALRQRLGRNLDERLHRLLVNDLDVFGLGEFTDLRAQLYDQEWQRRSAALRQLRENFGRFTEMELRLLQESLASTTSHIRAEAARTVGYIEGDVPDGLARALVRAALHDIDLATRTAAAASLGKLRDRIVSPQLIEEIEICLSDEDRFVRSAAAQVLCRIGDRAALPSISQKLLILLSDADPYNREMAALALGNLGAPVATARVFDALSRALDDGDAQVHEAASAALIKLYEVRRRTHPLKPGGNSTNTPSKKATGPLLTA